ncbi:hypothetical protein KIS4809_2323 [Bacillus sp. ZZV12-4809]|nr:hypothetical protein KIS4809_2323 [Bacillus sp. ZZV12-4809]
MNSLRKFISYILIVCLILPVTSISVYAEEGPEQSSAIESLIVYNPEADGNVVLYEEKNKESKQLIQLVSGIEVFVLEQQDEFSYVQYEIPEKEEIWIGYIENEFLITEDKAIELIPDFNLEKENNDGDNDNADLNEPTDENQSGIDESGDTSQDQAGESGTAGDQAEEPSIENEEEVPAIEDQEEESAISDVQEEEPAIEEVQETVSEEKESSNEKESVTASKNTLFKAAVAEVKLEGIALKQPTNVYSSPDRNSAVVRTFNQGSILLFYDHSLEWYRSSVNVDGKNQTIYINKQDVEQVTANPVKEEGFALVNPTNMYALPSRNSQVLRKFEAGTYLLYYTFTSDWYKSTVNVNGKNQVIYINKNDIEHPTTEPVKLEGVALSEPTNMYASPTKNSKVLKTFHSGSKLLYYTYTSNWYRSGVNVNGEYKTVYIYLDDVAQVTDKPVKQEGIAWKSPTNVYASPSRGAKVIKTYKPGSILLYYTFTSEWYRSSVNVNGKIHTVYINKSDIEEASPSSSTLQGIAHGSPTNVYQLPSSSSKILRTFSKGFVLKYYDYSKNWYRSSVNVNGQNQTCYIKKSDVSSQKSSSYGITLSQAVDMQMKAAPLTDTPDFGLAMSSEMSFLLNLKTQWYAATREQVQYYLDPNNFSPTSDEYLQFLILSSSAGTSESEVNAKILNGKGVLAGKANSFIEAARIYNINEIYLISHSLLETGNGTSNLAKGMVVNGVTVYNVYGIGAYDQDPEKLGAQFAYEQGWTSVEKAIVGGARFVSVNYIHSGQDTLYKMRWNPNGMVDKGYANHQYASDVGWAAKQTKKMAQMYSNLTQYTQLFDVPVYRQ